MYHFLKTLTGALKSDGWGFVLFWNCPKLGKPCYAEHTYENPDFVAKLEAAKRAFAEEGWTLYDQLDGSLGERWGHSHMGTRYLWVKNLVPDCSMLSGSIQLVSPENVLAKKYEGYMHHQK